MLVGVLEGVLVSTATDCSRVHYEGVLYYKVLP